MLNTNYIIIVLFLTIIHFGTSASEVDKHYGPTFELVVLGDTGGNQDGNLSAFLLRALTDNKYVGLDAGTLINGIDKAIQQHAFEDLIQQAERKFNPTITILHDHIAAYMISHGHLDHIAGLVIASPDDNAKPLYGLPSVNQAISNSYFNWQAWPNFTNRGKLPRLNKYTMIDLPLKEAIEISNTSLKVTAFSLSHPAESTAFLIENNDTIVVYFGDTGPDEVEKENKLDTLWRYLAKQLKHKRLAAMVIEVSFPDNRPDTLLFGHLTPEWLTKELTHFSSLLDKPMLLNKTKIIISHVKSSVLENVDARQIIQKQLNEHNKMGLHFIMARQGQKIIL
jgi:3',5'-cyclic-nucleotide phosphodiesterase